MYHEDWMLRYIRTYLFSSVLHCQFSGGEMGWIIYLCGDIQRFDHASPTYGHVTSEDCWGELLTKRRDNVLNYCSWTLTQPFRRSLIAWRRGVRRWHIFAITFEILRRKQRGHGNCWKYFGQNKEPAVLRYILINVITTHYRGGG